MGGEHPRRAQAPIPHVLRDIQRSGRRACPHPRARRRRRARAHLRADIRPLVDAVRGVPPGVGRHRAEHARDLRPRLEASLRAEMGRSAVRQRAPRRRPEVARRHDGGKRRDGLQGHEAARRRGGQIRDGRIEQIQDRLQHARQARRAAQHEDVRPRRGGNHAGARSRVANRGGVHPRRVRIVPHRGNRSP